jgi:hypothetical protein
MLWTQNTWAEGDHRAAAYRCLNGHVLDPSKTRECPTCGVHDTRVEADNDEGRRMHVCDACGARFSSRPPPDA